MTPGIRLSILVVALAHSELMMPSLANPQDEKLKDKTANLKKAEWEKLNGEWSVESALVAGNKLESNIAATMKLLLKDGKYESFAAAVSKGKISLNPAVKPKTMDLTVDDENGKEVQQVKCIYKLDKNKLVVVYAFQGDRPKKFESTTKNGFLMIEFKKKK